MTDDLQAAIAGVRDATARLLTTLESANSLDVTRPSLLPGWTVGHVLTHITRNADSFVWMLRSAADARQVPQYPGGAAERSRDIDKGASRAAEAIVEDVRSSAAGLDATWDEVPEVVWSRHGLRLDGSPFPCRVLPVSRWREVEVHHVDLGLGFGVSDWPEAFVDADLPHALDRLPAMIDDPRQRAELLVWVYGRSPQPPRTDLRPF